MISEFDDLIIASGATIRDALISIDKVGTAVSTLFVADADDKVLGTLTDGQWIHLLTKSCNAHLNL